MGGTSTNGGASRSLSIGEAASEVGRSAHTLRYYERIGLLGDVSRDAAGHRRYSEPQLGWLRFLDRLKAAGMPIVRMREYARLAFRGSATLAERYELLQAHRADLCGRMEELSRCLGVLERKMEFFENAEDSTYPSSPESACISNSTCGG